MSFANSGGGLPSPSTSIGPFLIKGDPSKLTSSVSLVTNSGDAELKETSSKLPPHSSYVISTSGLSPPYLLGESDGPDGNHNQVKCTLSHEIREINQRLIDTVVDISEEVVDSTCETPETEGSQGTIVRCSFNAVTIFNPDMTPKNVSVMLCSRLSVPYWYSFQGIMQIASLLKSSMLYYIKIPSKLNLLLYRNTVSLWKIIKLFLWARCGELLLLPPSSARERHLVTVEVKCTLSHEIREINQRLIDTVVDISEEVVDSTCETPETEGSQGTIVSYAAASQSLIGTRSRNYADCSPVLLDKLPTEVSFGYEDLSVKAKSKAQCNYAKSFANNFNQWDVGGPPQHCLAAYMPI
ncbi:hypothetical protein Vadar_001532 [Vaccinium darrowii]|uniref:Uncharacterized protein n=1 Tax=Vaccinium darrowii TaxID=229202 RepID=A0ACB7Z9B3_9ERIC|nr:hypothetical protein Vadar_001532 [Vaccinium darrowii]